jgi:hypothetical protein
MPTRGEIRQLIDEADALIQSQKDAEWRRAQNAASSDRRKHQPDLVYKDYRGPQPAQQSTKMDPETERKWNEWCNSVICNYLAETPFNQRQIDALGYTISELRAEWKAHVAEEIAKLRTEMSALKFEANVNDRAMRDEIIDLPGLKLRGSVRRHKRDAA